MFNKKLYFLTLFFMLLLSTVVVLAQDEGSETDGGADTPTETTEGDAATDEEEGTEDDPYGKFDNNFDDDEDNDYPYPRFSSDEYEKFVPNRKKRQQQQNAFRDGKYAFPARPKDKWEIGISAGLLMVSGDVKAKPGLGIGGTIRKSFGYIFSLRGGFMMGTAYGRNWQQTNGWSESSINNSNATPNKALGGAEGIYGEYNEDFDTPNYLGLNGEYLYYNYKTNIREAVISGILNLNNLKFHKRQTNWDIYGIAGIGGVFYRTMMDQLDGDGNEYDYSLDNLRRINGQVGENGEVLEYGMRREMLDALHSLRDGTYESQAERHFDDFSPFDNYAYKPTAHLGVGLAYRINRTFNVALETKVTYTNDDLLDGQRWQEWGALTRDYDTYTYTAFHLNVNLGRKTAVEPLWWMNPLDYAYQELAEPPCCDALPPLPDFGDDDNDGVPNAWDEEPDSREGCPVDTKGIMLDSDRDGILDCDDKCPHSQPFNMFGEPVEVDEFGCPPPTEITCDRIKDFEECVPERKTIYRDTTIINNITINRDTTITIVKEAVCDCPPPEIIDKTVTIEKTIVQQIPVPTPAPPPPPPPAPVPVPVPEPEPEPIPVPVKCCDNKIFPSILFDLNKYSVKPEFRPQLQQVANFINSTPNCEDKIAIIGHTDVRASNGYNESLSYKRALEVINILANEYGVPRYRLVVGYQGENNPKIAGLENAAAKVLGTDHALNRRVEIRCAMPGEYDMPSPGVYPNAGSRKPRP